MPARLAPAAQARDCCVCDGGHTMTHWCTMALLLAAGAPAAGEPTESPPAGRLDGDGVHVEILGQPVAVGARVELPEGWFRVEEQGVEEREAGSFSVVAAAATAEPPRAARV